MEMAKLSVQLDLFATTGSDYHAEKISRVDLGMQQQLPDICTPIWRIWSGK